MRIALVTGFLSRRGGGVSAVVEALSRSLRSDGLDVRVVGIADESWREDEKVWRGAPAIVLHSRGPAALAYSPSMATCLVDLAPDVVHVHGIWTHPSRSVLLWSRATGKPYVVSPHGMLDGWARDNARFKKLIAGLLYERAHLSRASCFHALCLPEAKAVRDLGLGVPVAVIPNGIGPAAATGDAARASPWFGTISPSRKVMLFLGRLHTKKNISGLLAAWAAIRREQSGVQVTNWMLVIAGWDQCRHEAELRETAAALGLADSVHFAGPLFGEAKDAAFRAADAFVLPSLSEGLPMAVLEAWSYGLPVLMTDACNLPEGFAAGAARRLPLATNEMAAALGAFFALPAAKLDLMSAAAHSIVETRFLWARAASELADVYRWTAVGGTRPSCLVY